MLPSRVTCTVCRVNSVEQKISQLRYNNMSVYECVYLQNMIRGLKNVVLACLRINVYGNLKIMKNHFSIR